MDDDADIRRSLKRLLEEEVDGVTVHEAADAARGLAALEQERFVLIISDYRMPGTDGLAFLEQAHRSHPDLPAVLLTAYPDPRLASVASQQAGVVIAKPLDLDYLVAIVASAASGRLRHRGGQN